MKYLLILLMINVSHAHHVFETLFDMNSPVILKGTVTKVRFTNPHVWIYLEVVGKNNKKQMWKVEGGSPNALYRKGITKKNIPVGTKLIVKGYQSKRKICNPECVASARDIILENGEKALKEK